MTMLSSSMRNLSEEKQPNYTWIRVSLSRSRTMVWNVTTRDIEMKEPIVVINLEVCFLFVKSLTL